MQYQFDVDIATRFGVDEAILIHNLVFWIIKNEANNNNLHDGHYWTYNSSTALQRLFPFWSAQKIGRLLRKLEDEGIIISSNYNKVAYDRTKWYTVIDKSIIKKYSIDCSELNNGFSEIDQPIPDSKPDSKPDSNSVSSLPTEDKMSKK